MDVKPGLWNRGMLARMPARQAGMPTPRRRDTLCGKPLARISILRSATFHRVARILRVGENVASMEQKAADLQKALDPRYGAAIF